MDKVVLETFEPEASCFNPPPSNQPDTCKVTVNFHNREDLKAPQPTLSFQREKDHYVLNPSMSPSTFAVLQGLTFNDKDSSVQGSLHFSVFLNKIHKSFYPSFLKASKYSGPDLLPLSKKMDDFIVSGDIVQPDEKQQKAAADLLREVLPYREPEQDWFTRPLKMLLNEAVSEGERPFEGAMPVPATIRPRLQWIRDQFKVHDELRNVFSPVQDAGLKKKAEACALASLIYVNTGDGNLKALQTELDALAPLLRSSPGALSDVYGSLLKTFSSYGKNSFFSQNATAAARLGNLNAFLKEATDSNRAELLGLNAAGGFRSFVESELKLPSVKISLMRKVEPELSASGISAQRVESELEGAARTILPHFTLAAEPGKSPRVKVSGAALVSEADRFIQETPASRRERQIAVLAVLRHLLGTGFSESKVKGWLQGQSTMVELDLSADDRKSVSLLAERLKGPASKKGGLWLPAAEGILTAGGIALTVAGHVDEGNARTPLNVIGPALTGFGAGALVCHVLWKSSNPLLTDGLCGVAGAALGVTLGAATTEDIPPPDPLSARNPNTAGGGGLCKPPNGGCGP